MLDPASDVIDAARRHAEGLRALRLTLSRQVPPGARARVWRLLKDALPADVATSPGLSVGTLWLGIPLDSPGLAVYVNGAWGDLHDQWDRVEASLRGQGVRDDVRAMLRPLRTHALASLGIEITPNGGCRVKVYFRLIAPRPLVGLGASLWTNDALIRVLDVGIGHRDIPSRGMVLSLGFDPSTPRPVDAKIDVCGHCLSRPGERDAVISRTARAFGDSGPPLGDWRTGVDVELAFIGAGASADGSTRWNVYFKGLS